jgi:hypothetical protein
VSAAKQVGVFEKAESCLKKSAELFLQLKKMFKFLQVQCKRLGAHQGYYGSKQNIDPF